MSEHRFYVPEVSEVDQRLRLPDDEAAHLTRVLRLGAGATIHLFDGQGHEFKASVTSVERHGVEAQCLEAVDPTPEPSVSLTLAQAVLKGRAFDDVVRDATMLGVRAIQPLVTERTNAPLDAVRRDALRARWQRVAVASSKQSGRAVVPVVRPVLSLIDHLSTCHDERHLMLVEPSASHAPTSALALAGPNPPATATVTIGPEGGWTEAEREQGKLRGCDVVTLGARTLRADAVPVAAVSVLLYVWGDL